MLSKINIPKSTSPLTKFIRTGEGVAASVFGVALIVVPFVESHLTPSVSNSINAGKWGLLIITVSRTALKGISLLSGVTGLAPTGEISGYQQGAIAANVDSVVKEIETGVEALTKIQNSTGGTPATEVVSGLAPGSTAPAQA